MRIILASSEVAPYSKTGGLGDVAGALPRALSRIGCDICAVAPRYTGWGSHPGDVVSHETGELIFDDLRVPFAGGVKYASVWRDWVDGAPIYFIDNVEYFGRGYIYGYGDFDVERFAFFSRAVIELAKRTGGPPDVIHCNDWQTGFIPAYLARVYTADPFFARTATLFTIHNLAYQGIFDPNLALKFGFGWDVYQYGMEFHGAANAMKAGIYFSTAVSTVSPKYAQEIQTPEFGVNLDGLLRQRRDSLIGILNGVDYNIWNPETDRDIAANYGIHDLSGKAVCKRDLLEKYNLPVDLEKPVVAIVSRLTAQKGIDLIAQAVWRMLETGAYFILLGSGAENYVSYFQHVRDTMPAQVGVYFGYNNALAHQIEAGADIFLMPSAYEPCGLNQMYSLKYGAAPIVRGVGGLDDTIRNFEITTGQGNGFKFYEYSGDRLIEKFYEALMVYYDPETWRKLLLNGMREDFSWDSSAHNYLTAYRQIAASKG
ncbi:MAG TPA: glycogen/starch synthase [Blastocatellia bacterium]|jgi:starch synthase|nr:glycogen/starch synthase [Blastocatellia bacterium]